MASKLKYHFNSRHLRKGDPLPPYSGALRVYNMRYCPYAQRLMLTLLAKGLPHEVVNVHPKEKPEWYINKNPPLGNVASLEVREDVTIPDSLAAVDYLDEVFPQRALLARDPVRRALDRILVQNCEPMYKLVFELIINPDSISEQSVAAYHKVLETLQAELAQRGTSFLGGEAPGYADYMIWPWFERMMVLADSDWRAEISADKFKLLLDYVGRMYEDPAVQQYLAPKVVLSQVFKDPQFDI